MRVVSIIHTHKQAAPFWLGIMTADGERKGRKRREKQNDSLFPSQIVCTSSDAAHDKRSVELGVVLSFVVLGLYLFGFVASLQALPDVSTGREIGGNLLVAKLLSDKALASSVDSSARSLSMPNDKEASEESFSVDGVPIPSATWPVSTRDEEGDFEVLVHTGDGTTEMLVPKFWSPPLHNNKHFTREQAMKVGTCITPDPITGSHVRGTDCPPDERTIFIAIASYRDYQCRYTVESAFNKAKNPHRIRIGEYIQEHFRGRSSGIQ